MAKLVLIRHGESQWNLDNRFTGWVDIPLTEKGRKDARVAGEKIRDIKLDLAFTSKLIRAIDTLTEVMQGAEQTKIPVDQDSALNERHYGDLQGLNKAEAAKNFGDEQVKIWRRSYATPPPGGESLEMTARRTLPYFDWRIMSQLKQGKNVVIAAHGNSLRAICMELDKLTPEQVVALEIANGQPIVYEIDSNGKAVSKKLL